MARLDPLMRDADLTVGQFGTLEALLHLGPLCRRDLGRKLLRSGGNITVVVGNLARRGLVRRGAERARKETGNGATPHPLRLARAL